MVFRALLTQYTDDIVNGSSTYVSINQINKLLRKHNIYSEDYEIQIRQTIQRIRSSIKRKSDAEIIKSENWKGYKLSDTVFIGKIQ